MFGNELGKLKNEEGQRGSEKRGKRKFTNVGSWVERINCSPIHTQKPESRLGHRSTIRGRGNIRGYEW